MKEYYWELILRDGTRLEIPPSGVDVVKRRMSAHDPINTKSQVIPYAQIEHFRITNKPYGQALLLDEVAQVFNEPQENDDGSIIYKWVTKQVTQDRWNKYYSHHGAYKRVGAEGSMMTVAFRQPVHLVDTNNTPYATDQEIAEINKKY